MRATILSVFASKKHGGIMGYVDEIKKESQKKGLLATAAGVGTVGLAVLATPYVVVAGAPYTVYLTYKWFEHRAKNGLRF
jgi:hypothetical protein